MIDLYRSITEKILAIVDSEEVDDVQLKICLTKRQELIASLKGQELEKIRDMYKEDGLYELDEEIKEKLKEKILDLRKQLNEYKINKNVNIVYANMNKNNLNIFSRKV